MKYVAETKNSDVQQQSSFQNVKLGCRGAGDSHLPPELSNLMHQVLATERVGPLRRGDFVLRTTNLRSWIAADATHLHYTIFIKTANWFAGVQVTFTCRGV